LALVLSALDWVAVERHVHRLEYVFKPAATTAFLATALTLDPASNVSRTWCCIALGLCVVGDVLLMLERDAFLQGLAAFAVAQMCFTVNFALQEPTPLRLALGLGLVVPGVVILTRRFTGVLARGRDRPLVPAVTCYSVVIAAMAVSAIAGGTPPGIVGALLFLTSDSLIAEHRFVSPRGWLPVAIMVTYDLALTGLVLGLL
jgi:uncharacterized membrane protein YhhN